MSGERVKTSTRTSMGWVGKGREPFDDYLHRSSSSFSTARSLATLAANIPAIRLQCGETGYLSEQLPLFHPLEADTIICV